MATKTVIMLGTSHRHPNDKGHYGKVFAKLEFNDDPKFKDSVVDLLEGIADKKITFVDTDRQVGI